MIQSYALEQSEVGFENLLRKKHEKMVSEKKRRKSLKKNHINVAVRLKPSMYDRCEFSEIQVRNNKVLVTQPLEKKVFTVDKTFDACDVNHDVYQYVLNKAVLPTIKGFNTCVVAGGMIGTGKTHTLFGCGVKKKKISKKRYCSESEWKSFAKGKGVVQKSVSRLFSYIFENSGKEVDFRVFFSMYEVLQNQPRDLLSANVEKKLRTKMKKEHGTYIDNLSVFGAKTKKEAMEILGKGLTKRTTRADSNSSLGHVIIDIYFTRYSRKGTSKFYRGERLSKMTFVDLAGCQPSDTVSMDGKSSQYAVIDKANNLSYTHLKSVCMSLGRGRKEKRREGANFVNFRNSKLTFLLQDRLCGDCKTTFLLCLDSNFSKLGESLTILGMGEVFRNVVTNPKKQGDRKMDVMLDEMQTELLGLQEALEKAYMDEAEKIQQAIFETSEKERMKYEKLIDAKMSLLQRQYGEDLEKKDAEIKYLNHSIGALTRWKEFNKLKIEDKTREIEEIRSEMITLKINQLKQAPAQEARIAELEKKVGVYEGLLSQSRRVIDEKQHSLDVMDLKVKEYEEALKEAEELRKENLDLSATIERIEGDKQVMESRLDELKKREQLEETFMKEKGRVEEKIDEIKTRREHIMRLGQEDSGRELFMQMDQLSREKEKYLEALKKVVFSSDELDDSLKQVEKDLNEISEIETYSDSGSDLVLRDSPSEGITPATDDEAEVIQFECSSGGESSKDILGV